MRVLFYWYLGLKRLKKDFKGKTGHKNKLIIIGFCEQSQMFLSREYFKILSFLKGEDFKKSSVLFLFYIKFNNKKNVNGMFLKGGKILSIFGESFTEKFFLTKINSKNILFLFYFDLYNIKIKNKIDFAKVDFTIGLEDDDVGDGLVFLDNKFFNKLVISGFNGKVIGKNKKNILKIAENVCEYNIQKNKKLIK